MIVTVNLAVTLKMDSDDNDFEDTFVPQTTENKNSRHQKFLEVFIYIYVLGSINITFMAIETVFKIENL